MRQVVFGLGIMLDKSLKISEFEYVITYCFTCNKRFASLNQHAF